MTKTRQDKSAKPAAVELRDDALDQAAAGGDVNGDGVADFELQLNSSTVFVRPRTGVLKA